MHLNTRSSTCLQVELCYNENYLYAALMGVSSAGCFATAEVALSGVALPSVLMLLALRKSMQSGCLLLLYALSQRPLTRGEWGGTTLFYGYKEPMHETYTHKLQIMELRLQVC